MKRSLINLILVVLNFSAFYFVACQKEQHEAENALITAEAPAFQNTAESSADDRCCGIEIEKIEKFCDCKQGHTCGSWVYTATKRNGIRVTLRLFTHVTFNASGPGLRYRIYNGNSCSGAAIADFYCNTQIVEYVNSALNNGATYSLKISSGTAQACFPFVAGACNGQSCNNNGGN
jgi:hypothetical protein